MKKSVIIALGIVAVSQLLAIVNLTFGIADQKTISEIRLVSPDGNRTVTISAHNGYAGIWIANKQTGRAIHIFESGQCGIGIFDNYRKATGCTAALSVQDGSGFLQLIDEPREGRKARVRIANAEELNLPNGIILNEKQ